MKTQLYTYYGIPLFEVAVDESSSQDWSLMSDNKLSISFELEECVVLTAGCYIDFDSTRFYLLNEYKPTMICSSVWKYDLTLGDAASWLSITLALKTIDGENTPLFKYTAPAAEHAAIIVANLNRRMDTDQWKVGSVISTENIAIDYSGKYCSDVLQEIVDAKNTEWWIDGMTLNIGPAEFGESVTLGYMNGVLGDIVCDTAGDMRSYAYLFPIGSTRNIDPTKYGHDRLQLPSGLKSVPINPEQGVAELVEEAAFAHIYPRYEGTVSAVRYTTAKNEDGTSFLIYYIKDTAIPFNPNEFEIPGLVKHITFQSGELMGQEFEVNYSADSNEFELITRWTGDIQLPGGVLVPAVGDKYVVWNISMPDVYYTIASHELLDAARAYAADAIKDVSVYKVKLDYIDVQERGLKLRPGQRVRLQSDEYFASGYYDSRITRITRNIAYPDELSVDISAVRMVGTLSRLQASIQKTENVVAQFSGQLPAIIKSNDDTSANDSSVYTSAKSEKEFLNKRKGGRVAAPVTFDEVAEFLEGLVAHKYIKVGNGYLKYNDDLGVWEMVGDLLVTGAVTMFGSLSGFKPSTIMDGVLVDGETIVKTKNSQGQWQLTAIGGGGGTGGGGLTTDEVNLLIENALKPYALATSIPTDNKQLSNGAGYATISDISSSLVGYATQSWVGDNYLSKSGGTITIDGIAGFTIYRNNGVYSAIHFYNTQDGTKTDVGYLGAASNGRPVYLDAGGSVFDLIHSGNIGLYNAGSANVLKKSFANENINYGAGNGLKLIYCHSNPGNFASDWQSGISVLTDYTGWQLTSYGGVNIPNPYFRQRDDAGIWRDWHQLAFLTDNVASATKLQTARTIWGQSFDGTGNISGLLTNVDGIRGSTTNGGYIGDRNKGLGATDGGSMIYNYSSSPITFHIAGSEYMRITNGGNVVIGGTTADAKLHIHGNAKIGAIYLERSNEINVYDGDKTVYLNYASSGNVAMCIGGGNVTIGGTTVSEKFNVQGNVLIKGGDNPYLLIKDHQDRNWYIQYYKDYISLGAGFANSVKIDSIGNLIAPGAITMFSQLSMKNVIDYDGLSLAQLAQIEPARFTWKDGRDTLVHAGGIADEVMQVLPEVVYRTKDDKLTMDYGSAGFFMSASLIKPVIDHEKRIKELEREAKYLREENRQLRAS